MPVAKDPAQAEANRTAQAERMRRLWADPKYKARASARIKKARSSADSKAKSSSASKKAWGSPEAHEKRTESLRAAHAEGRMGDYSHFKGKKGEQTSQWKGDRVGYRAMHARIRNELGPASDFACVDCDEDANEWSFRHGGPGEYSTDIEDYDARCYACHRAHDDSFRSSEEKARVRNRIAETSRERWADPAYRERAVAAMRARAATPEAKRIRSEATKRWRAKKAGDV